MRPPRSVSLKRFVLTVTAIFLVALAFIACGGALIDDTVRSLP